MSRPERGAFANIGEAIGPPVVMIAGRGWSVAIAEIDLGRCRVRVSKTQVTLAVRQPRQGADPGPSHFIFCLRQRMPAGRHGLCQS